VNAELLLAALHEALPNEPLRVRRLPTDELLIPISPGSLLAAVDVMVTRMGISHLSTITAEDTGSEIVLLYHFWAHGGITLQTALPREAATIQSVAEVVPGAAFYEREAAEMLGVVFAGGRGPGRLLLPDDWDGAPPLRKPEVESP
jgi:NADH-quinone oxidoreductase subunit C